MNIALLTDADVFAGTERHILDLAVALGAQGQTVTIACPVPAPLADKARAAGIRVVPVAKRRMPDFAAIKILAAELRSGRVDIIHAHNGRTHLLSVAAVKLAGRGRVVATQHFLAPNRTGRHGPKALLAGILHRWAGKNTAAFIAISQAVKDQMLIRGDAPAEKITVVHNGTPEPEKTSPELIAALRMELGVGNRPMIFCAARLQKEKDIPTLIKAVAALRFNDHGSMSNDQKLPEGTQNLEPGIWNTGNLRQAPPAGQNTECIANTAITECTEDSNSFPKLFIAGEGDQRGECERLIAALRFNDQGAMTNDQKLMDDGGEFTTKTQRHEGPGEDPQISQIAGLAGQPAGRGPVASEQNGGAALPENSRFQVPGSSFSSGIRLLGFRSDVSALMAACDIFVLPAPAEPFGLVIIEAMALGKPVIAAGAGGPLEIVADGETGLLFSPGSSDSLAAGMKRLLTDADLRQRMGAAGRKRYEEMFTAQQMAEKMLAAYAASR